MSAGLAVLWDNGEIICVEATNSTSSVLNRADKERGKSGRNFIPVDKTAATVEYSIFALDKDDLQILDKNKIDYSDPKYVNFVLRSCKHVGSYSAVAAK